jgi:cysteine desulfurase
MAKAAEMSYAAINDEAPRLVALRSYLTNRILSEIPGSKLTGDPVYRLPNNASFVFDGIRGEELVELLSMYGIYCSSGSACETGSGEPSHVLTAIGLSEEEANGSLRLTLGRDTNLEELDYAIEKLKSSVETLRRR